MGTKRIGRVGERDAGFHSNGALPSALSCCHYGSEVFRSCRKQSYDSENTEDETTEPQVEPKGGAGRHHEKGARKGPSGEGDRMMDYNPDGSDRQSTLPGSYDPIVERELRTLNSRPPGPNMDPTNPSRTQNDEEIYGSFSHAPLTSPQPPPITHINHTNASNPGENQPRPPNDSDKASKLARAGPKISDKVRAFEERRLSVDLPDLVGSIPGLDCREKNKEATQKRTAFKQRASSLEDNNSFSQRVQSYQNKFTEELDRIKKLVRTDIKKAYSTEQLPRKDCLMTSKVEPIPPEVVKKLEARRDLEGTRAWEAGRPQTKVSKRAKPSPKKNTAHYSSQGSTGNNSVAMETAPVHQLPGQPLTTAKTGLIRETTQSSSHTLVAALPEHRSASRKDKDRSHSPTGKRALPVTVREAGSQYPAKPPRLTPSPTPSTSPHLKRCKAIPAILVEDETVPTEHDESEMGRKEEKRDKGKIGHSEEGISPDGDEGAEPPRFKTPLKDTIAPCSSKVTLTCTIRGKPPPTVRWTKNSEDIRNDSLRVVKAEGHKHSLVIRCSGSSDAGWYYVTAVNAAGKASCKATLHILSEPCKRSVRSPEAGSPTHLSDNEYMNLKEEVMEHNQDAPALTKSVNFKEPPYFQVGPCDQTVMEGQDVVISVKVTGQPKPTLHWLKDNAPVKTAGRFSVQETDSGSSEMKIISAKRSDAGLYICKVVNQSGIKQEECRVEVKGAAQTNLKIKQDIKDVTVRGGESAMFECHVAGPPDMDVDWLSNGKLIQPALLNCKMHFDGRRCRLLLNSVHEDDSGTYTCKLSTAKEELTSSASLKVTPSKEPLFTRKLDILEVIAGRTARFDCKVSGSPAPQVTWMHFDARVEESDNVHVLSEGGRHSLVIANVSGDTEGFYTAMAQNVHGKSECTAELYMQEHRAAISSHMSTLEKMPSIPEEPEHIESEVEKRTMPDFVKPLVDMEVIEGKETVLCCKVTGLPYPTIAWYHSGKRIESSEERKMTQYRDVHSLLIQSARHADGGVYKAVIANKVGKAACYAHLYVTDIIPEPPDGPPVIETITGKTITLSWKRPKRLDASYDPGSLLYVLQQQPLGSIQWSNVASNLRETSYTVNCLSKGVRYAFRVLASTGKTLSKPSPSTDLVQLLDRGPYLKKAPVIVDKPDILYVVDNQPASISITLNHVHATVTWKRRGTSLVNKPGVCEMSMPDDDQHSLTLQRVKASDLGQLVVLASNQFGSDLCMLELAMAVSPKFETIMEDVDVEAGQTSLLAVVVEGKPDPDILWYKDDELLSESSYFTFVYDDPEYSLVILNARPGHSGVYTCTVKNMAGSNSCKAELTVHTERKEAIEPMEDKGTILRKMRRLTDYYDLHKEIGRGAFSYIKRVTQKKGKKDFAAKFTSARGKRKALALREMELLSTLDHERIIYFQDAFEKKNVVVLITELCHEELLERMSRRTTVTELEIRRSVQQVLEGLRYLHEKGIAHLDIKPENILMTGTSSDQIRICDFGNAIRLESSEEHYCKYGTPEYVSPEIVNQTPVSTATDIWPVGVITYLCLTGVSPFAGENDRATALNIRNYNVAFEESMFSALCKEARGFVIKLLVVDRLRPSAVECLRHPWFKSESNNGICTARLKQTLSRRRWQRSLISYKSKMVMRTIPEILNDASNHVSIAVARQLKDGSPPPSSSSDSEADVDELPFIPMPISMFFSGSRVSLNEIPADEHIAVEKTKDDLDTISPDEINQETKRAPFKKGLSTESDESQTKARRSTMRRGSSADSALLLHIDPEEDNAIEDTETSSNSLKKATSLELPHRSPSPGMTKLSQEDYALKLELMRQRLLRGGNMDKKMSGLRGPLFETLGMEDERQTGSLDRNLRRSRTGQSTLTRAASSENAGEDTTKTRVFRKSVSFTQGDSEPMPLHRRYGAPLEIPSVINVSTESKKLQEATSMSALTGQTMLESASPTEHNNFVYPTPGKVDQRKKLNYEEKIANKDKLNEVESELKLPSVVTPIIVIEEDDDEEDTRKKYQDMQIHGEEVMEDKETSQTYKESFAKRSSAEAIVVSSETSDQVPDKSRGRPEPKENALSSKHLAVFAKVAAGHSSSASNSSLSNPDISGMLSHPKLRTDIKDIDSEEVFESRFKKRESSLTRGLRKLTRNKSEGESPVPSRKIGGGGEEVYRPGPRGAPLEMSSKGLQEKSKSVQDLREDEIKERGLSLIGRFSLRGKRSPSDDKKGDKSTERKTQDAQESAATKRVTWAIGRSKSLDTKEQDREQRKADESAISSVRRRFESKVAGISAKIRTQSEDRKDKHAEGSQKETDLKKITDSSVFAMRQKFENKVAGISTKIRSQSDERKENTEGKRTPLFSRHRHSRSEGRGLQEICVPENQLAKQVAVGTSKESIESVSSVHSEKENDRRSRWDRWGLSRSKKDKTPSQTDILLPAPKEEENSNTPKFVRSASDFPPVFHIKLKDQILLEGEQVTLCCLPAGSPPPDISWMKDRKAVLADDRISLISHPDGRQLLTILKCSHKDAGVYECLATNPIAAITTSCTLSIAYIPKRPGTPEVPQTYNNTALVLWKPADTKPPCSYTLERKSEGDSTWQTVATRVVDCYYNVTDLPRGGLFRFRVSCVNKAGQGPHSNCSAPVNLDSTAQDAIPEVAVVKTANKREPLVSPSSIPQLTPMMTVTVTAAEDATAQVMSPSAAESPSSLGPSSHNTPKNTPHDPKTSAKHPSAPFIVPKPQSPVNIVSPMTQSPITLVTPPSTPTKPASVPIKGTTASVATSPVSFSPQVLQTSSLSPIGEGVSTPGRGTPSTALRQGVPQKPYTFLDEKSRGRFGVIRECRENATGRMYMAKIIPYSHENKQEVLKEYEILKSLHNERVMALHEAYVTPRYVVLVAEYYTGKELLHSLIDRFRYSEDDVVEYLVQILQGVEYLHNRRVLHLDLKPDNIMVTNNNTIKIVDFGSAQSFNPLSLKQQDSVTGTLEYMAPEMVKGEVVGPPADIWTVGIVIYIMLSGRLPFQDKDLQRVKSKILTAKFDPTRLYPNVSQSASAFVKKMLSSYAWARPTTRDCITHAWLQDTYLMKLRRQTLTFATAGLKEFLVEQQCRRAESSTKHKVQLRTYQNAPRSVPPGPGPK
ncbi:striated muscle preferentially expressed protein kinase-like isoform X2 [Entelurus aequoreus]|uniref:striated muscle preferentially expressed protein kinase-like isoform X2 n=1 Tax=Entelurus aequoreus TaxID=161455 RepID=UPI002B1D6CA2|nr:striated muscle preferentially expressed protein kinase-like isoform X2 [Entelurus aequoreus]XP_061918766.1 striated muscle preferentially expressed protein kinase-like isoform X2 [Entelurus aequoreus]